MMLPQSVLSYVITKEGVMNVGNELRSARLERGITVRRLAELGKTSPAAISQIETGSRGVSVDRFASLLKKTRHRYIVLPTIASSVSEVAESIGQFLKKADNQAAYREFISFSDSLKKQQLGVRVALTLSEPDTTGSALYDAALASLVEYWLNKDGLPIPDWVFDPSRSLSQTEHLREGIYGRTPDSEEVLPEFLNRNVLFPAVALESV
jgi:transcriptional regulator with XRE-family HTH domain